MAITGLLILLLATSTAWENADNPDGSYSFGLSSDGFLPPAKKNAYGPGIDSDATGRPFYWSPRDKAPSGPDPTLRVNPDGYGLGVGRDQYGRPVERRGW